MRPEGVQLHPAEGSAVVHPKEPDVAHLPIVFEFPAVSAVQQLEPDVAQLQSAFEAPVAPVAILIQLNEPVTLSLFVHSTAVSDQLYAARQPALLAAIMQPDVQYVATLHQCISAVVVYHPEAP